MKTKQTAQKKPTSKANLVSKFHEMRKSDSNTTEEAFELYDKLETVSMLDIIGRWHGSGFKTNHTMDGALETFHWYGKEFINPENVHPLVFKGWGGKLFIVNPSLMPVGLATKIPSTNLGFLAPIFLLFRFLFQTSKSKARVRMLEFRGKSSATMIYDNLPINDVFRKVDDDTLMGCMDFKKMEQPFFFVLERD